MKKIKEKQEMKLLVAGLFIERNSKCGSYPETTGTSASLEWNIFHEQWKPKAWDGQI